MYALVGLLGLALFLLSVPMAIIKRRTNLRFWLAMVGISLLLVVGALEATPESTTDTARTADGSIAPEVVEANEPISPVDEPKSTEEEPEVSEDDEPDEGSPEDLSPAQTASKTIATYLFENFGGGGDPRYATSWYDNIKSVNLKMNDDGSADVTVVTNIYPDSDADRIAPSIARAILLNGKVEVGLVTVKGQKDSTLGAWRVTTAP
ncbi:MAG TPA: hypothetical protein GXX23_09375 [Firmicutes bacterium]|nr:hypothetical protein [Candidatus Fermentithermobacillaceae bacterium]